MKIGIITIHNSPNYGAGLQSFALFKYLEQLGHDVEIIDLHRPYYEDYMPSRKFKPNLNREESFIHFIKRKIKGFFSPFQKNITTFIPRATNENSLRKFNEFNSQIRLSKPYRGIDELYANPPLYDIYITGSDQVWNPAQSYCIEPYFLTFVRHGRRISYASSIGIENLTKKEKRNYRKWLSAYDVISVRETQAQALLSSITKRKIYKVADPTFLLDKEYWLNLSIKPKISNYILVFTLSHNDKFVEYGKQLATTSGKFLVVLNQIQPKDDGTYIAETVAGPQEFLGYIRYADMVITDSFHCSVFSIILGTANFYTYIAPWNKRGSRILDLLHSYHLDNHILSVALDQSYAELSIHEPDKDYIELQYKQEQSASRQFLLDNLD